MPVNWNRLVWTSVERLLMPTLQRVATSLILSSLFLFFSTALAQSQQDGVDESWVVNTRYGFPIWVAANHHRGDQRRIYLYIAAEDFAPEKTQKALTGLAAEFTDSPFLWIYAYSNK